MIDFAENGMSRALHGMFERSARDIAIEIPALPCLEPRSLTPATVALRSVFLHLTKACNLRCDYCYFSVSRPLPDELTRAELQPL